MTAWSGWGEKQHETFIAELRDRWGGRALLCYNSLTQQILYSFLIPMADTFSTPHWADHG